VTDIEMATLWAEILDIDEAEADDHFFEIGGNSLLAIDVVTAIQARTGVAVPLGDFFADPTPSAVAAVVARRSDGARLSAGQPHREPAGR
jgi:acyl carrier protein